MDSFELNKIAGALLAASLFAMGLGILSNDIIFKAEKPAKPGYVIALAETPTTPGGAAPVVNVAPIADRLKVATAEDGKKAFAKCGSCHSADKGGKNGTGPNLWGIVGGPMAHASGFAYSPAMSEEAKGGGTWNYDHLDKFLENPQAALKGTKMSFAGLKRPEERAAVIQYLRSLADSPQPLPN